MRTIIGESSTTIYGYQLPYFLYTKETEEAVEKQLSRVGAKITRRTARSLTNVLHHPAARTLRRLDLDDLPLHFALRKDTDHMYCLALRESTGLHLELRPLHPVTGQPAGLDPGRHLEASARLLLTLDREPADWTFIAFSNETNEHDNHMFEVEDADEIKPIN